MLRIFLLIFIIASVFLHLNEGSVNLRIRITNYVNTENLLHNGAKCETFHWMGDHCDPMFEICVTTGYWRCDIKNKFINFHANKRTIDKIWEETIPLRTFPKVINVHVKVTDHDRYDAHDLIANFNKDFRVTQPGFNYWTSMEVYPPRLNVHLFAEVKITCKENFYGPRCANYCVPKSGLNDCDKITGEKICLVNCGFHGQCVLHSYGVSVWSNCKCSEGWIGYRCHINVRTTSSSTVTSTIMSSINTTFVDSTTTEKSIPSTVNIFSKFKFKETTLASSHSPSTTLQDNSFADSKDQTPTTKSFKTSMLPEFIEGPQQLSMLNFNFKSNNNKNTVRPLVARLKQKDYGNENGLANSSKINTSQILIIVGMFITMCVILLFGHRYLKLKYKYKYLNRCQAQRSLPPVIFKSDHNNQDCTVYTTADSEYDTCSININFNDQTEDVKFQNAPIEEDNHYYETPICKNRQT